MSRFGKIKVLIAVTWLLVIVSGSSAQLAGRWTMVGCNTPARFGFFRSEEERILTGCKYIGFPMNMELLRDGTGIVDNDSKSWKTQGNRMYFMGSPARAFNYKLSGSTLTLINDDGNEATYLEPSAAKKAEENREAAARKAKENQEAAAKAARRGTVTDKRDGRTYRTVKMPDNKTWLAENLNYKIGNSWCYDNDDSKCKLYGRLYDWNTAMIACPTGWHLPNDQEWAHLSKSIGDWTVVGTKLKTRSGWNDNGNGTDNYGFSVLPGGSRDTDGSFSAIGGGGYWWTASDGGSDFAHYLYVLSNYMSADDYNKGLGFSVRCVKDDVR